MNKDFSIIKYFPEESVPEKLKKRILNRIMVIKFRPLIYLFAAGLIIHLGFLSNHIYRLSLETEVLAVIKVMVTDFELSSDYLLNISAGLKEILPMFSIYLLIINLALVSLMIKLFKHFNSELL